VSLDVLRDFARSRTELISIRLAADEAGVGRSTLHKFITAETIPHPRVRRLLALWYQRHLEGVNETDLVRPYKSALEILLTNVPETSHERVTMDVLESIEKGYTTEGEVAPRWLEALRRRLSRKRFNGP
jgi:hypothetical protein